MRHGLQLAGIRLLWLVGLKIDWDCPVPHCIMGSCHQWEFPNVFETPVTVPLHCLNGNCLPLGLCKGTVKESKCSCTLGLYSLSRRTSYRKISRSLEAARFEFKLFQLLWNLTGTSVLLPRCLSNFRVIRLLWHPISWLRDFTRFGGKTSYHLVNRGLRV